MAMFEIKPLVSVGPIRFGMPRSEAIAVMREIAGDPDRGRNDSEDDWFERQFRVFYNSEDWVEFVELSPAGVVDVAFEGAVLNKMSPEDAIAFVSRFATKELMDAEPACEYIFPELQVSLWRPFSGTKEQHETDQKGEFRFRAYGAGREGYFDKQLERAKKLREEIRKMPPIKNPFA